MALAHHREILVAGLQRQRGVAGGKAAIGIDRHLAEVGIVEMAVADGAIGLEYHPLDADVGGRGGFARDNGRLIGRGLARGDKRGSQESGCRMRQRKTNQSSRRHLRTPYGLHSSTSHYRAAMGLPSW